MRCLESKLKELGYSISGPNGTYDSKTVAAVKAFERSKGLPVDGKADPYTLTKLGIWAGPKVSFPCSVKISVYPTSTGGHVRCLESRLKSLGYSINSVYDGRVDQSTIGAIRRYQGSHALGVDGIAGPATMTKLGIWAGRPPAQILPANSGTGRRIVYSKSQMRLWTVEANGTVSKTHLVTGNRQWNNPLPGTYRVYSKSRRTCAVGNTNICWGYMVRFAYGPNGGRIGFHEIPTNLTTGTRLSTISQLGQSLSAGCVRQTTSDAIYIWNWAPVGTKVVVLN